MSMRLTTLCLLLLSALPGAASADVCAQVYPQGRYQFERNLDILRNGPVSCAAMSVRTRFEDVSYSAQIGPGGGPVQVLAVDQRTGQGLLSYAAAGLGTNHVAALDVSQGMVSDGVSMWTDVMAVSGPVSESPVRISFFGHIDGTLPAYKGDDIAPNERARYVLQIGTTSFSLMANAFSVGTGTWRDDPDFEPMSYVSRGPFTPGTDNHIAVDFRVDLDFLFPSAAPLSFGVYGLLSATGSDGAVADLGNTASLDAITMPLGYSISAHGVALSQDVQGRFLYAAAVPEPQPAAMLLVGLLGLAWLQRRHGA